VFAYSPISIKYKVKVNNVEVKDLEPNKYFGYKYSDKGLFAFQDNTEK